MKKYFWIITVVLLIAAAGASYYVFKQRLVKEPVPVAVDFVQVESQQTSSQQTITSELNLKMAFYTQAPFSDWNMPWQEACEEASMLLVANTYFNHQWTRENFRDEILKLVEWENKTFGDYKDTTTKQMVQMLKDYFGLKAVVYKDPTFADVQKVLDRGHFIIMPFAGKQIGNPNYKNGGPLYHAMVIKGYKAGEKVITNDVGTRNGADYVYQWSTLQKALHDFNTPITDGAKLMIEVLPPASS